MINYSFIIKTTTKNEMRDAVLSDYLVNFYFIYFLLHVAELSFSFQFLSFTFNFDFFLSIMTNNQTKCSVIYKKFAMQAGDMNE